MDGSPSQGDRSVRKATDPYGSRDSSHHIAGGWGRGCTRQCVRDLHAPQNSQRFLVRDLAGVVMNEVSLRKQALEDMGAWLYPSGGNPDSKPGNVRCVQHASRY